MKSIHVILKKMVDIIGYCTLYVLYSFVLRKQTMEMLAWGEVGGVSNLHVQ